MRGTGYAVRGLSQKTGVSVVWCQVSVFANSEHRTLKPEYHHAIISNQHPGSRTGIAMQEKASSESIKLIIQLRFVFLLLALVLFIILMPFVDELFEHSIFLDIFLTFIFIAAVYSIVGNKKHLIIAVILALPLIFAIWSQYAVKSASIRMIGDIFGVLLFAFTIWGLLSFILRANDVNKEIIFAAIAVYLLLALMWSFIYMILEYFSPGSFAIPEARTELGRFVAVYYSFVTITTLGFGDITPLTDKASSLSILEAIVGQIYLVVLVAFLVGMHVSRKSN
jgi:hypothetical protein